MHFCVGVIINAELGSTDPDYIRGVFEDELDAILQDFDENLEVPEYEEECWCIGRIANMNCSNFVREILGDSNHIFNDFTSSHEYVIKTQEIPGWIDTPEGYARWTEILGEYTKKGRKLSDFYLEYDPMWNMPDPECPDCHGTGRRWTTRNPNGMFDYYEISDWNANEFIESYYDTVENILHRWIDGEHLTIYALIDTFGDKVENRSKNTQPYEDEFTKEQWEEMIHQKLLENVGNYLIIVDMHS